jgi:signal transduction histidine kinase
LRHESALNVDAPVTLDELLDKNARTTLVDGALDLGVAITVVDRDGKLICGDEPAPELVAVDVEFEPRLFGAHMVSRLLHEGDAFGTVIVGPFAAPVDEERARMAAQHLARIADAFITEGIKRAMSARMHMATVEEASRELTEKNRRLALMVERLQEADRVKSNFLATVSHELRTPLTSIIGYSEMLLEGIAGDLNNEQREYVRTVMEKGDQLLQIITGILDISRMEAGQMRIERQPFDLDEVVSVAVQTIAPHARRKKLSLSCELPPDLPMVLGDRDRIRQVLLNLINNSIKFTPEGGAISIRGEVGLLARHAPDPSLDAQTRRLGTDPEGAPVRRAVRVTVRDTGVGIPPEHHTRVFDPFFQVDNSSTREYGGTGLGLNIVKRFVEAHGGAVWVESQEGQGATFYFTLPLAPTEV